MVKKFSPEFKHQAVDYALSNAHQPISVLANHLGIGKSTLDKWIRQHNPTKTSRRELSPEQQRIVALEKENIAMSENEGNFDAVHSYDSEAVTAGAMQKTVNSNGFGELSEQVLKFKRNNPNLYLQLFEAYG